jgi:hypothetical protein
VRRSVVDDKRERERERERGERERRERERERESAREKKARTPQLVFCGGELLAIRGPGCNNFKYVIGKQ